MTAVKTLRSVPHNGVTVPKGETITDASESVIESWRAWKWVKLQPEAAAGNDGKGNGGRKRS